MMSRRWVRKYTCGCNPYTARERRPQGKVSEVALGVEATKRQATPHGATEAGGGLARHVGEASGGCCPQPRRRRRKGERYERGREEGKAAGGGQPDLSRFHAGCLLSTILLREWPDEGQPSAPR